MARHRSHSADKARTRRREFYRRYFHSYGEITEYIKSTLNMNSLRGNDCTMVITDSLSEIATLAAPPALVVHGPAGDVIDGEVLTPAEARKQDTLKRYTEMYGGLAGRRALIDTVSDEAHKSDAPHYVQMVGRAQRNIRALGDATRYIFDNPRAGKLITSVAEYKREIAHAPVLKLERKKDD